MPAPFPQSTALTAILVGYKSVNSYIADDVLPYVPVATESFQYTVYGPEAFMDITDDRAGRIGALNSVQVQGSVQSATVVDRGLKEPVPQRDVMAAQSNPAIDPEGMAVMRIAEYLKINREQRAANLVFATGSYDAANVLPLSGASQWSDYVNSDPLGNILAGMDTCLVPPNVLVLGQEVFTKLRQHPKIAKAVLGNAGDSTVASAQALAELVGVQRVLVGQARGNTAKPGQPPVMSRLWGKHAAALYVNPMADTMGGLTFGFTGRWGQAVAGRNEVKPGDMGIYGGVEVYAGQSIIELAVANRAGFFFQNAIA